MRFPAGFNAIGGGGCNPWRLVHRIGGYAYGPLNIDHSCGEVCNVRCLIIDDSREFREAARLLLQQEGITVVGMASSAEEAMRLARDLRPDVTLIDIDLGDEDGLALARWLAESDGQPGGKLILISTHAEYEFADIVADSPAVGFISKSALSAEAIYALTGSRPEGGA